VSRYDPSCEVSRSDGDAFINGMIKRGLAVRGPHGAAWTHAVERERLNARPEPEPQRQKHVEAPPSTGGQKEGASMEEAKKQPNVSPTARPTHVDRLALSAQRAPYRIARMRALKGGRTALLVALGPYLDAAALNALGTYLATEAGQGMLIGLIGLAGPHVPRFGQDPRVRALSDEFLDEGVALGLNGAVGLLARLVEPALQAALEAIPDPQPNSIVDAMAGGKADAQF